MSRLSIVMVVLLSLGLVRAGAQTTIHVPADQKTIQFGIDAARNGDTVLVAPGTYSENIDFKGKAITVTSSDGAAVTILDGGSKAPAVTFQTNETRAAVLSGMTIQHGGGYGLAYTAANNGGLYIASSSPTILMNEITQNECFDIYINDAAPLIFGNHITATLSPAIGCGFGSGAAIYAGGNYASAASGTGTPPVIMANLIEDNVMSGFSDAGGNGGAGVAVWGGGAIIASNTFRNNSSPGGSGGAINLQFSSGVAIVENLIYGNSAGCGGGAIAFNAGGVQAGISPLIASNTIVDNIGQNDAGYSECFAVSQVYPSPDAYGYSGPSAVFVNNILSGSTTEPAVVCNSLFAFTSGHELPSEATQPIFDHNVLYNAGGKFFDVSCVDVSAKYGNIAADPQFVDQTSGDYHLKATSPAIDAGNNAALQSIATMTGTPLAVDAGGNPRVQDATGLAYPVIDIGAYEYGGKVDATATTIVLTSSSYYGDAGSNYVLTATLASALGTPTGQVSFFLDDTQIGTSQISGMGVATLSNFVLVPGVHVLYALYGGQGTFSPVKSVIVVLEINPYSTTLSLKSAPNPSGVGLPVTFTLTALSSDDGSVPSPVQLSDSSNNNAALATLLPNSAGVATYTTSTLTLGNHQIQASYAGDATHSSSYTTLEQQVGYATTCAIVPYINPAQTKDAVVFQLTVTSTDPKTGQPPGTVQFFLDSTQQPNVDLAPQTGSSSVAVATLTFATVGDYSLQMIYVPDSSSSFQPCSAMLVEKVRVKPLTPSMTSLAASPNLAPALTPVTLTAQVAALSGTAAQASAPTGTVTFSDGGTVLGKGPVSATGVATYNAAFVAGTHPLTASYSGDANYSPSSGIYSEVAKLNLTTTTLVVNPSPTATAFLPVTLSARTLSPAAPVPVSTQVCPAPPCAAPSVSFFSGMNLLGSANLDATGAAVLTIGLPAGMDSLTAAFPGNAAFGSSASAVVAETVVPQTPTLTLTVSPASPIQNHLTTLTAALTTSNVPASALSGTSVKFLDGAAEIQTATVTAAGGVSPAPLLFSVQTKTLAVGPHTVTAVFSGNASIAPATATISFIVAEQDFRLATAIPKISIKTGERAPVAVDLTTIGSLADTVDLSCSNLPVDANCTFEKTPVVTDAGTASYTTNVMIDTLARPSYTYASVLPKRWLGRGISLALLLPLLAAGRRGRKWARLAILAIALIMPLVLTGCSGRYPAHTPPGTYAITVTATARAAQIVHTARLTLVVTP